MEEIRHYEAQNKVENSVPDTVLTGKSPCCAKHGIRLTAGVGGKLHGRVDICTVFGSLPGNAIEYELPCPTGNCA